MADSKFPVLLFYERGLDRSHAEQVGMWFNRFPGPVTVTVVDKRVRLPLTDQSVLLWYNIFEKLMELRIEANAPDDTFVYLLTKSPNELNWFATEDENQMRNAFGHVEDFSWVTSAPPSVIASHYILKTIFNALLSDAAVNWKKLWHNEPRGCFFDFCERKHELGLKLRTADICTDCMEAFASAGLPDALLRQTVEIMEASRRLTLNTAAFLEPDLLFDRWPFPVAITRHKVLHASNPFSRLNLLIDHFDSLVRYCYLANEVWAGRQPTMVDLPALGWWVDQLGHSAGTDSHLQRAVSIAQEERIVHLRNERRGHGYVSPNEESYLEDAEQLEEVLSRMEGELEPFLISHQLVVLRKISCPEGRYVVDLEHLVGSHVLHRRVTQSIDRDPVSCGLIENAVSLTDASLSEFRPISPYIRLARCPECRHPRILITDGSSRYIDGFVGHRVKLSP